MPAPRSPEDHFAARLLGIYKARLASNLTHALRPLIGQNAREAADGIAAMIDGLYIRQGLHGGEYDPRKAVALVSHYVDCWTERN